MCVAGGCTWGGGGLQLGFFMLVRKRSSGAFSEKHEECRKIPELNPDIPSLDWREKTESVDEAAQF